jgi:hypothetical protein
MKITNKQLKQIIKEELENVLYEGPDSGEKKLLLNQLMYLANLGQKKYTKLMQRVKWANELYSDYAQGDVGFEFFKRAYSQLVAVEGVDSNILGGFQHAGILPYDFKDSDNLDELIKGTSDVFDVMTTVSTGPENVWDQINIHIEDIAGIDEEKADTIRANITKKLGLEGSNSSDHQKGVRRNRNLLQKAGSWISGKGFKQ